MGKTGNLLFTSVMLTTLLLLTGCTRNVTEENHYHENGATVFVDYVTAYKEDWSIYGTPGVMGCYMYQTFKFPEITKSVLDNGFVLAFLIDDSTVDGRDNILPFILPYNGGVTENIRYDYEEGKLTIIIESTDFMTYSRTGSLIFKVCILYP